MAEQGIGAKTRRIDRIRSPSSLRIDATLHRRVAIAADSAAESANAWIADALEAVTKATRPEAARSQKKRRTAARKATG